MLYVTFLTLLHQKSVFCINNIEAVYQHIERMVEMTKSSEKQKKIACFFRQGGNVFLDKIVNCLSDHFDIRSIVIKTDADLKLVDHWMEWGDICWFEWCDSVLVYASHLPAAKNKKIICRLHSYEAFTNYPNNVDWSNVDKLIFVADHIRRYVKIGRAHV